MSVPVLEISIMKDKGGRDAPWDDLATLQSPPEILFDMFVRNIVSDLFLHEELPAENFLVSEADTECEYVV